MRSWNEPSSAGHHTITDETDSSLQLKRVVDTEGVETMKDVNIEEECIIQEDPFEDRDPDEEAYEGFTGNAGASATHWYRDTVMVIVKREKLMNFKLRSYSTGGTYSSGRKDMLPLLERYLGYAMASPHGMQSRQDVMAICDHVISRNSRDRYDRFSDEVVGKVVVALVTSYTNQSMLSIEPAVKCVSERGRLPLEAFAALGTVVQAVNFALLRPALKCAISKDNTIGGVLGSMKALFGTELENASTPHHAEFVESSLWRGGALADVAILDVRSDRIKQIFAQLILPVVLRNASHSLFAISFLACWGAKAKQAWDDDYVAAVFQQVWGLMLAGFHIDRLEDMPGRRAIAAGRLATRPTSTNGVLATDDAGENLATLFALAVTNQHMVNSLLLVQAIVRDAVTVKPELLLRIHVPFLRHIAHGVAATLDGEGAAQPLTDMFNDCWTLNLFLASATQQVGRLTVGKNARHHHQFLDATGFDGTHETERTDREPQTLVVTKRDRQQQTYNAWLIRCRTAYEELQKFNEQNLRKVLSDDFDRIMAMECIVNDYAAAPEFLQTSHVPRAPPLVPASRGTKRKVEVIDLCSDSD
ncbi:hypothetical protein LTR85_003254 [Meristemomyces frigidus]|nr:hypothetical protein LTR85_003254 [Meristemomyces frigidus]